MGTPSRWSSLAIAHPVVLAPMDGVGTPALALPAAALVATLVEELVAAPRE